MGIPRSVIAYGLAGIISTRLVRKICPTCAVPYQPTDSEKSIIGLSGENVSFMKGKGCEFCRGTGYFGQTGIFEIVRFDDEIKTKIIEDVSRSSLRDFFLKKIKKSLRDSAIEKVCQGVTTASEIIHLINY